LPSTPLHASDTSPAAFSLQGLRNVRTWERRSVGTKQGHLPSIGTPGCIPVRSYAPTLLRSHVPTFPRSHVPTFLRSHAPTFLPPATVSGCISRRTDCECCRCRHRAR